MLEKGEKICYIGCMTNTLILYPYDKQLYKSPPSANLDEVVSLAGAIDLVVVDSDLIAMRAIKSATYLSTGVVDRYCDIIKDNKIDLVVIASPLSPLQQRNLEKLWHTKVIDKTALILEIFGARARTKEGKLQVELANLTYARSRLVRSWTHLERQRGGAGFLGGPGETQIELDRRLIDTDIVKIKNQLEMVKKTRHLHRFSRKKVPFPIVALVGYTNAGKSTLFNYLTQSDVMAKDMLFATLDTTMRKVKLPSGKDIILSDTVGFISDLPTELIMAFRATLEEVQDADLIIHVRDYHHDNSPQQKADVEAVLRDLGLDEQVDKGLIEALNKIDLFDSSEQAAIYRKKKRQARQIPLSAHTGAGVDDLLKTIENQLFAAYPTLYLAIPAENGKILALLYQKGQICTQKLLENTHYITAKIPESHHYLFTPFIVEPF